MNTWPDVCPSCNGAWKVKSRTMGAAQGQPHKGRCENGHWWYEPWAVSPAKQKEPAPVTEPDLAVAIRHHAEYYLDQSDYFSIDTPHGKIYVYIGRHAPTDWPEPADVVPLTQ